MRVVATAGHVDHGKSSLILALTGTDPDRFPEEKARGLTIDIGFAFTELPSGQTVGFVDVPGHARFVKNMLAGVGAVDVAMLIVAANEGWMAQTEEHVAILDLLDVRHGLVVVTKADLVDDDGLELARLEVEERRPGWPLVVVDSISGRGLDEVRTVLDEVLAAAPAPLDRQRPRLWVDRVFSARGAGTIVTGTLVGGALAVEDEVLVAPRSRPARVRGIEVSHARVERVEPGNRVALNLVGIAHDEVTRGDAIVRPGQWIETSIVHVAVEASTGHGIPKRARLHAHVGSGEHEATFRTLDDEGRYARVRFPVALPLAPGDRIVLRSSARQATIGGGVVLDVEPTRYPLAAVARLTLPLGARVMRGDRWATPDELARLVGANDAAEALVRDGHAVSVGRWFVAPDALASVRTQAAQLVEVDTGPGVPLAAIASALGLDPAQARAALAEDPRFTVAQDLVRSSAAAALEDDPAAQQLLDALRAAPFNPPAPADVGASPALVRALVRSGRLVDLDGVILHAEALEAARQRIAAAVMERGTLTISDARDVLGSTRKYVVPIMNKLDAEGITRRRGDDRIAGPRAESIARE